MPAHEGGAARTGAGVRNLQWRKPREARWRVRRCGDLSSAPEGKCPLMVIIGEKLIEEAKIAAIP